MKDRVIVYVPADRRSAFLKMMEREGYKVEEKSGSCCGWEECKTSACGCSSEGCGCECDQSLCSEEGVC